MSTRAETTAKRPGAHDDTGGRTRATRGQSAVWQARLILLVMINVAQLWILSAAVEAALAHHYSSLVPLVVASGVCWLVALSVVFWWRPVSRRYTSTGYVRERRSNRG